jgi:CRP/FNR family transcriptional regulator, cyclic AMP receptor protein
MFLGGSYWFGELPAEMKRAIIDCGEIRYFRRGATLYRIGDFVDGMYAALEGDFRAYAFGDEGERILLRLVGPGSWFGEFHLIDEYPARTFEIWAASDCAALFLPKSAYDAILEGNPAHLRQFVRLTCIHQRHLLRIAIEARSDAGRRTARALIRIAKMHGSEAGVGVQISIGINQSDLASLVGVSRQYMNELISRWNDEGLLTWKGNTAPILFIDRLKRLLTPLDDWMLDSEGWA